MYSIQGGGTVDKAQRISFARQLLELMAEDKPNYGDRTWEADVGRFTDRRRFLLEKQRFFLERPQLIALSCDVPEPGDFYTTDIAGRRILILRDREGTVRSYLNACRHRGAQLVEGCGKASRFVCPYHGWSYSLKGDLIGVTDRPAFDEGNLHGLVALPTREGLGVIVVHPDPGGALDLDEFLGPMADILGYLKLDECRLLFSHRAPARINWKHTADGGLESYHAPILHSKTVGKYAVKQQLHLELGLHHSMISTSGQLRTLAGVPESEWPDNPFLNFINVIFPNTMIALGGPLRVMTRGEPRDEPGLVDFVLRIYAKPAATEEERTMLANAVELTRVVALEEDLTMQQSAQAMMESGTVRSVLFGRREISLTQMHQLYDSLIGHDAAAALAGAYYFRGTA